MSQTNTATTKNTATKNIALTPRANAAGNIGRSLALAVIAGLLPAVAHAAPADAPAAPPVPPPSASAPASAPAPATAPVASAEETADAEKLLGTPFRSESQGVTFRRPADCKEEHQPGENEIVEFTNESRNWTFRVTRSTWDKPQHLTTVRDAKGNEVPGLVEQAVARLTEDTPGTEVVRSDVSSVGDLWAGLIIVRYKQGTQTLLRHYALVQANDQLYYVFNFVAPAGKEKGDASEMQAYHTFSAVLDTVQLIDRGPIRQDQVRRLIATRGLLLDWTEQRMASVLIPHQWLRLMQDGKDIGWSYVEEMTGRERRALTGRPRPLPANPELLPDGTAKPLGNIPDDGLITDDGVVIYSRSWTQPDPVTKATEVNTGAEMFITFDRKLERFAHVAAVYQRPKAEPKADGTADAKADAAAANGPMEVVNGSTEFGESLRRTKRVFKLKQPELMGVQDGNDAGQPLSRLVEVYKLDVELKGKFAKADPVHRELPPFYLPEALGHLLPRMLPLREPKSYLFASYVTDKREIMMRYVDVGTEKDVNIAGKTVRAIPVKEKLGLEGSETIHYMSPGGTWLQTVTPSQNFMILPTDAETLLKIWPNADLRLEQIEAPDRLRTGDRSSDPLRDRSDPRDRPDPRDAREPRDGGTDSPSDSPRPLVRPRLGTTGGGR